MLHDLALAFLGVILLACAGADAASFTIVGGNHTAVIALSRKPTPTEKLAASEFTRYIKQMSGVELKTVETSKPPSGALVIGCPRGSAVLSPELGDEGYSIAIRDGCLHIEGARGRSVLYAVYDLLERLGCRWLAPEFDHYNGQAEFVPKRSALAIGLERTVVERPVFKFRKLYVEEGRSHDLKNLPQLIDWMGKARYNTLVVPIDYQHAGRVKWDNWRSALTPELHRRDIQIEVGGHGYQNFLNAEMEGGALFETHPDWFGMDENGARRREGGRVFCTANEAAVEYLTKNVLRYLKDRPEIDIFDFWPPDGAKWCTCPSCRQLGPPDDRQSRLIGHVVAAAGRSNVLVRFECIAYHLTLKPPSNPPMEKSVLVDFCPSFQCYEMPIYDPSPSENAGYAEALQAWKKTFSGDVSIYSYYRKYAWVSLPVVIPHYMRDDMRWYTKIGISGISVYSEPGDWRTYELNHYTLARLAWDLQLDVDKTISDFCIARHGKNAGAAKRVYQALEDTVRHGCCIPGTSLKEPSVLEGYALRLQKASDRLKSSAPGSQSATRLLTSVEYALRNLALQKSVSEGGSAEARAKMIDDLLVFFDKHRDEGLFVIHDRRSRERLAAAFKVPPQTPPNSSPP